MNTGTFNGLITFSLQKMPWMKERVS